MGHLFVLQGDVTRLACDAWALPCDAAFDTTPAWRDVVGGRKARGIADVPSAWGDDGARVARARVAGTPTVWLLNSGGHGERSAAWYVEGIRQFIDAAEAYVDKERPLVAIPFVGSGAGGKRFERGGLLERMVDALADEISDRRADVAFVAREPEVLAAAQAIRRDGRDRHWADLDRELADRAVALAEHAKAGRLVVFFGAGVGRGAGLPTWDGLLESLATGLDASAIDAADVRDKARLIELSLLERDATALREEIVALFAAYTRYSLVHGLLASLPVDEFVTTNYDTLFESAADAAGRPPVVLPYERIRHGGARWLLKMHGSVSKPDDIVLTRDDYLQYGERRGALMGIVQALLITRHMLFVGFSLTDENFHRIAYDVRRALPPSGGARNRHGTALLVEEQRALERLWADDLEFVTLASDATTGGRTLAIFLDRVLAEATTSARHLLDPTFAELLTPEQEALASALRGLRREEDAAAAPEWVFVERLLADLGDGTARAPS